MSAYLVVRAFEHTQAWLTVEYPGFHSWQDCVSPCLQSLKWLQLGSGNAACPVIDLSLEVRDSRLSPWSEHLSGQSSLPMVRTSFGTVISPHGPNIFRDSHLSPWSEHLSQVPCRLVWLHPGNLSPIHFVQCCVIDQERLSIRSYCMEHVRLVNVKSQAPPGRSRSSPGPGFSRVQLPSRTALRCHLHIRGP